MEVLRLGPSFCSLQKIDIFELIKDLYLFARNLTYKYIFDKDRGRKETGGEEMYKGFKVQDFCTLKTLIQLLDENDGFGADEQTITSSSSDEEGNDMEIAFDSHKFKAISTKFPQLQTCLAVWAFLKQTIKHVKRF